MRAGSCPLGNLSFTVRARGQRHSSNLPHRRARANTIGRNTPAYHARSPGLSSVQLCDGILATTVTARSCSARPLDANADARQVLQAIRDTHLAGKCVVELCNSSDSDQEPSKLLLLVCQLYRAKTRHQFDRRAAPCQSTHIVGKTLDSIRIRYPSCTSRQECQWGPPSILVDTRPRRLGKLALD